MFDAPDVDRLVTLGRIRVRRMAAAGLAVALAVTAAMVALQEDAESRTEPDAVDVHVPDDDEPTAP